MLWILNLQPVTVKRHTAHAEIGGAILVRKQTRVRVRMDEIDLDVRRLFALGVVEFWVVEFWVVDEVVEFWGIDDVVAQACLVVQGWLACVCHHYLIDPRHCVIVHILVDTIHVSKHFQSLRRRKPRILTAHQNVNVGITPFASEQTLQQSRAKQTKTTGAHLVKQNRRARFAHQRAQVFEDNIGDRRRTRLIPTRPEPREALNPR
jgi:hypothetical protein